VGGGGALCEKWCQHKNHVTSAGRNSSAICQRRDQIARVVTVVSTSSAFGVGGQVSEAIFRHPNWGECSPHPKKLGKCTQKGVVTSGLWQARPGLGTRTRAT